MKLLVTGGAGFLGSHVIRRWLAHHPMDEIVNLDLLTYAGSPERLADLAGNPRYRFVHGDICNPAAVRSAMQGATLVVHFAAETHVDRSITNAAPFLRTNVEGAYVLLQEAQAAGVSQFVHVSTDEVYGPVLEGAVSEQAPLVPCSPYAASKAAGDLLAQAFHRTHGLPVRIVRPTNVYGPAQFPEKFLPLVITYALDGRPIPVYGDGRQRRCWLFVEDLCDAIEVVAAKGRDGEIYNVAGGMELENLETAAKILGSLGASPSLLQRVADRPGHDRRYAMDDRKLRTLGWQPATPFEQGITRTVTWYREQADWWRPLVSRLREDSYHWLNRSPRPSAQPPPVAVL